MAYNQKPTISGFFYGIDKMQEENPEPSTQQMIAVIFEHLEIMNNSINGLKNDIKCQVDGLKDDIKCQVEGLKNDIKRQNTLSTNHIKHTSRILENIKLPQYGGMINYPEKVIPGMAFKERRDEDQWVDLPNLR